MISKYSFEKESNKALKNKNLQEALINITDRFRSARKNAVSDSDNWEQLRQVAHNIKEQTINNLHNYLQLLDNNIINAGGHVHWATDSKQACEIIRQIAQKNKAKKIVKSKSMATEEIHLNKSLESHGYSVVETDLGEYILQISGETPSHIIAPAIHKRKVDISKLFSEKFNVPEYDDPQELTKIAREKLRSEFLSADMGISGVNLAAADTGTIAIVENEGNARLTTTVPKVHVALMGIEKVIPRFDQMGLFLKLLIGSATGQKISTYVSLITGPRKKGETDGPKEFHLVLLDNGRSKILSNPNTRESLYCLRCGACLNICPVYRKVGGHAYGGTYSGPIGAIINPQLEGIEKYPDLPFASSLCGACKDVCPVKIDFPKVLLDLRRQVIENKSIHKSRGGLAEKLSFRIWKKINQSPKVLKILSNIAYYIQLPFINNNKKISSLPFIFSRWTKTRDLAPIAKKSFRQIWKEKNNG
jgi:L-lactate dehydrogenase complex protein LldF